MRGNGKNVSLDEELRSFSLEEAFLTRKNYKVIFCIAFIVAALRMALRFVSMLLGWEVGGVGRGCRGSSLVNYGAYIMVYFFVYPCCLCGSYHFHGSVERKDRYVGASTLEAEKNRFSTKQRMKGRGK
ncbi:hypothetical protein [Bartonella sp. TT110JLCBS]|uniref:hypothetical protein n=1 Tax=Bartonella sp. TT110JLCBS TaxID=3243578 RepID=UPI0035D04FED